MEIREIEESKVANCIPGIDKSSLIEYFVYHPSVKICSRLLKKRPKVLNEYYWNSHIINNWDGERSSLTKAPPGWKPIYHFTAENALYNACAYGDVEKVEFLLQNGADVNMIGYLSDLELNVKRQITDGKTSLIPGKQKDFPIFATLLKDKKNSKIRISIFKLLLEYGVNLNIKDYLGRDIWQLAKTEPYVAEVMGLLENIKSKE